MKDRLLLLPTGLLAAEWMLTFFVTVQHRLAVPVTRDTFRRFCHRS